MKKYIILLTVCLLLLTFLNTPAVYANTTVHQFLEAYNLPPDTTREEFYEYLISNATIKPWVGYLSPSATQDEIINYLNWNNPKPAALGIEVDSEFQNWHIGFYAPWPKVEILPLSPDQLKPLDLEPLPPLPPFTTLIKNQYSEKGLSGMFPNTTEAYESGMIAELLLGVVVDWGIRVAVGPFLTGAYDILTPLIGHTGSTIIMEKFSSYSKPVKAPPPKPAPRPTPASGPGSTGNEPLSPPKRSSSDNEQQNDSTGAGEWVSPDGASGSWDSGTGASGSWTNSSLTWDDGEGGGGSLNW